LSGEKAHHLSKASCQHYLKIGGWDGVFDLPEMDCHEKYAVVVEADVEVDVEVDVDAGVGDASDFDRSSVLDLTRATNGSAFGLRVVFAGYHRIVQFLHVAMACCHRRHDPKAAPGPG
jgi:hypothetical protein